MFPLLCKLFSNETKFQLFGSKFFLSPVQFIIKELDIMQNENKLNYATLVLCMLNKNSLSEEILEDENDENFIQMKKKSLNKCKLEQGTDTFKFVDVLSAMEGTYTKKCGTQYTFIHDSMFEICAHQYGKQFPDQMLLYMSSSYIANYVKPEASEPGIVNKEKQSDSQGSESRDKKCKPSDSESSVGSEIQDKQQKRSDSQSSVWGESRHKKKETE
jgi:hypothetical protein